MDFNPWNVLSLEAFHFYCCPECESKHGTKDQFVEHAMSMHPKARETIMSILDSNVTISCVQPISVLDQERIKVESSDMDPISEEYQQESDFDEVNMDNSISIKMENIENIEPDFHEVDIKNIINTERIEPTVVFAEDCSVVKAKTVTNPKCDIQIAKKPKGSVQCKKKGVAFTNASLYIYKCKQCPKKYKSKYDLEKHFKTKHEEFSFDCDHCNKSFVTLYDLRMHVSWKHSNATQFFECHLCQKVCNSQTGLDFHLTSAHSAEEEISKVFKCKHCSFTSIDRGQLQNHFHTAHKDAVKPKVFKCDYCPRTSTTQSGLTNHIQTSHKEVSNLVTVAVKKKRVKMDDNSCYIRIKKGRKGSGKYKREKVARNLYIFECDQCPKNYKSKYDLEKHIKTKHEGLSFDCDQCNKSFGTSYALRMHVSLKHSVTQSFECHLCHKVCNSQTGLDFHLTTHYLDKNSRMLKCDHCSYTTYKGYALKHHKLTVHEGFVTARPFKCELCEKDFTRKLHLKRHMRTKHDMKEIGHQENSQSVPNQSVPNGL